MKDRERRDANRELWDTWTELHSQSDFYDLEAFRAGESTLCDIELAELGDAVKNRSLLHLQCHFGLDTLSWARRGARVTGMDFSSKAIELARKLAQEVALEARFVCSDVYDLPKVLDDSFDIVFTSYGVTGWLRDLDRWARVIADYLVPGGTFYMVEFHPAVYTFDDDGTPFKESYFPQTKPIVTQEKGSYGAPDADTVGTSYYWPHSLDETLTALLAVGLRLDSFREFPYSPHNCFPFTEEVTPGKSIIPALGERVPLTFSVKMTKET